MDEVIDPALDHGGHVTWTCPMHPQIVRNGPGSCPICGMALEPREAQADAVNPELAGMTLRFQVSVALTFFVLLFMVSEFMPGDPLKRALGMTLSQWIEFALATPVVLWGGWPFFVKAWLSVRNRSLNMFTLIALGTGAAYLQSVFALLFAAALGSDTAVYFEPAAVIVTLVLLGQVLELRARSRTSSAIRALLGLARGQRESLRQTAPNETSRSMGLWLATVSAYARARRLRWMVRFWKAAVLWMSP